MREGNSNSRTTAKRSPPEAARLRRVLDFEFISRPRSAKKSMRKSKSSAVSYVLSQHLSLTSLPVGAFQQVFQTMAARGVGAHSAIRADSN